MIKNPRAGKFIIIEGIDGAGGGTQSELLFSFFKKEKAHVKKLSYPDYSGPIGDLIHQFLHKKYDFSPENQFLLYFSDFLKDKESIKKWKKEGKIIISDRYFTSTLAYQGLRGFPIKKALNMAKLFGLPRPDLIIYLNISPQTSIKRKYKEKRKLDRNEADREFLERLTKFYRYLARNNIFGKWVIIDGEKPIKKVFAQIKKLM